MAAFTAYWRHVFWSYLPAEDPGPRLKVMFGGIHRSQPSFVAAGVGPGDRVFAVTAHRRRVYLLGAMTVKDIVELALDETAESSGLLAQYAEWSFLADDCTSEVVLGEAGTPIRRDRVLTGDVLAAWRYLNRRRERALSNLEGDQLTRHDAIWGIYRLSPETARTLAALTGDRLTVAT
jgi:hypothetical protein